MASSTRPYNLHIICGALPRSGESASQQVAVGALDNAGGVIVPAIEGEDQFAVEHKVLRLAS